MGSNPITGTWKGRALKISEDMIDKVRELFTELRKLSHIGIYLGEKETLFKLYDDNGELNLVIVGWDEEDQEFSLVTSSLSDDR